MRWCYCGFRHKLLFPLHHLIGMVNFIFKIVYYKFETESLYWALGHFCFIGGLNMEIIY